MTSKLRLKITKSVLICIFLIGVIVNADRISHSGVIKNCKRSLALLEPDVVIYTNDIDFKPDEEYKSG